MVIAKTLQPGDLGCCIALGWVKMEVKVLSRESSESLLLSYQCGDKKSSMIQKGMCWEGAGNAKSRFKSSEVPAEVNQDQPKCACRHICCQPCHWKPASSQRRHISVMEEVERPEGLLGPESPPEPPTHSHS